MSISPFQLFGIKPSFDVNQQVVEETYLSLQKQLHPDNFVNKSPSEQMYAMSAGANLNDAYNILTDSVNLSCQILEINGFMDILNRKPSAALMGEQFELREALDEDENLENLKQDVAKRIEECYKNLSASFSKQDYKNAVDQTIELRFLTKFAKDVKRKLRKK